MSNQQETDKAVESFCQHPKLLEFMKNGIETRKVAENALLVYLHLIEAQNWFDVQSVVVPKHQLVFLHGKRNNKDKVEYVLPLVSDFAANTQSLDDYIDIATESGCTDDSLLLAFVDDTSSIVFYTLSKGLIAPNKPSTRELQKMNQIPEWNEQKGKWKF